MKTRVTIKDLARILKVSTSTVSRALKDHPDISKETKEQVNKLAKELKYKPNAIALSLRSKHSNIIGVIIPQIVHHFFSSVISGIEDVANKSGYHVMICQSNESFRREVMNVQALYSSRVDGVLVSMSKETQTYNHFKDIINGGTHVVFFDRICDEIDTDRVVVDDEKGAYDATKYLIETGCRNISHLSASQHMLIGRKRRKGYEKALKKYNLSIHEDLIRKCDNYDDALKITKELLESPTPPDGVFAVNDLTALGAMKAIKDKGLKIPEDVSVIGFTDGLVSQVSDPKLSTVEQHGYEIGQKSMEILLKRIKDDVDDFTPTTKVIKTNLVIRESTK